MMQATLFLATLALGSSVQKDEPLPPGPIQGIAGIGGIQLESTIRFVKDPTAEEEPAVHVLEATYLFPDRARWRLHAIGVDAMAREFVFRFGEQAWKVPDGRHSSIVLTQSDRDVTLLQMELRRAVFHYPNGFAWSGSNPERPTAVVRRSSSGERPVIGSLEATVEDGSLVRISALDQAGRAIESLEVSTWQAVGEARWPRDLVLTQDGQVVWHETVRAVSTRAHYLDRFFQPPDTRRGGTMLVQGRLVREIPLSPITYRLRELPPATPWEEALDRAREWIALAGKELQGHPIDPVPCFELDDTGAPLRCVVRFEKAISEAPEGWTTRWDTPGLGLVLDRLEDLDGSVLALLRRSVSPAERNGTPYCRVHEPGAAARVELYLPIAAGD